jgi:hypothetical protein
VPRRDRSADHARGSSTGNDRSAGIPNWGRAEAIRHRITPIQPARRQRSVPFDKVQAMAFFKRTSSARFRKSASSRWRALAQPLSRAVGMLGPCVLSFAAVVGPASDGYAQYNDNVQMYESNWQPSGNKYQPFGPVNFQHAWQPFAPIGPCNEYGGRDVWSQGVFMNVSRMYWTITRPHRSALGDTDPMIVSPGDGRGFVEQTNGVNIAVAEMPFTAGTRYDLGYWDGSTGWGASYFNSGTQVQGFTQQGVSINFVNPPIPVFDWFDGTRVQIATITRLHGFVDATSPFVDEWGRDENTALAGVDPNVVGGFGYLPPFVPNDGFDDYLRDGLDDNLNTTRGANGANFGRTTAAGAPVARTAIDFFDMAIFPTHFDEVTVRNFTEMNGGEVMKLFRFRPFHHGSLLELSAGARYMELDDRFQVNALGGLGSAFLDLGMQHDPDTGVIVPVRVESFWDMRVQNNIVGPQFGARWSGRKGRWNYAAEGKFFAGFNFQNVRQRGQIGGNLTSGVTVDSGRQPVASVRNPTIIPGIPYDTTPTIDVAQGGASSNTQVGPVTLVANTVTLLLAGDPTTLAPEEKILLTQFPPTGVREPTFIPAPTPGIVAVPTAYVWNGIVGKDVLLQNAPWYLDNTYFDNFERFEEWSPGVELRLSTSYQLTKAVALSGGWTGQFQDNVGRAASMMVYQLPTLGINGDRNREWVFMHGFHLGIEVNR